jgi:rubrerythrin
MEIVAEPVARPPTTEQPTDSPLGKRLELRCAVCSFGAIVVRAPDRCPMCGAAEWLAA